MDDEDGDMDIRGPGVNVDEKRMRGREISGRKSTVERATRLSGMVGRRNHRHLVAGLHLQWKKIHVKNESELRRAVGAR